MKHQHKTESKFVGHEPCPKCGSKDNLGRYDDGHAFCYGCQYYEFADDDKRDILSVGILHRGLEMTGVVAAIPELRLSKATMQLYGVTIEYDSVGKIVKHHYPYVDKGTNETTGTKVRVCDSKQFFATGGFQNVGLFGQQKFKGGGRYITITEGEKDCLAVSEMFDNKWPVVSIRSGAPNAAKDIKENLEYSRVF